MSDDRLFASNNAIGRKWYFLNIVILAIIAVVTEYAFNEFLIPNAQTEAYTLIAQGFMYFAYLIYIITFFSLIDRRLFDVCSERNTEGYKNTSAFLKLAVLFQTTIVATQFAGVHAPVGYDFLQDIAWIFNSIFLIIVFCLGFIKGKISCLTYEQYKKQMKYK